LTGFGGRFEPKKGWNYVFEVGKVWDILQDREPETNTRTFSSGRPPRC